MSEDGRYLKQKRFWLDLSKEDEAGLNDFIDSLKPIRKYQPFIRKAIRIARALESEDLEPLLEAYPWIAYVFQQPPVPGGDGTIYRPMGISNGTEPEVVFSVESEKSSEEIVNNFGDMLSGWDDY